MARSERVHNNAPPPTEATTRSVKKREFGSEKIHMMHDNFRHKNGIICGTAECFADGEYVCVCYMCMAYHCFTRERDRERELGTRSHEKARQKHAFGRTCVQTVYNVIQSKEWRGSVLRPLAVI